jgi:tetratricopeptide (TPR) repeat protein
MFARLVRVCSLGCLLAGGVAAIPRHPVQAAPARSRNQQADKELKARKLFAAGQFQEALDLFAELYAETLHPVYLRNIGRCHQKLREPAKAIDAFRDYLAKGKDITVDERKEVEGFIRDMEALQDEQRKAAAPPPPPVAPEPRLTVAEPPPTTAATTVAASAPAAEESHPFYTRAWFWVGVGVVAAGAVAAAVLLGSGGGSKPPCTSDLVGCK